MRTFATTDTHGCFRELKQVLDAAQFKYDEDILIHIGDCTDRGPDSFLVIEELLKIKNLIAVQGNHDHYMLNFIRTGYHPWKHWSHRKHGSHRTIMSYAKNYEYEEVQVAIKMSGISTNFEPIHVPQSHRNFFENQRPFYIDSENRLFVHGGYDPMEFIETQMPSFMTWDRDLVERQAAYLKRELEAPRYPDVNDFKRVFIGHTPTNYFKRFSDNSPFVEPMYMGQLVNLDTGCCFGNRLSLIDITDDANHILYQSEIFDPTPYEAV